MVAIAHQLDDEPQEDPAEAAMSEAAFEVIQRAHEICGHPPARELTVEVDLEQRAEQARSEAQAILQEIAPETFTEATNTISPVENSPAELPDDVKPPITDWKQAAQDAWDGESWTKAAEDYHTKRGADRTIGEIEPEKLHRLRALLADEVSPQRAWNAVNSALGRAAQSTVDALVFSLRTGVSVLDDRDVRRRLTELSDEQFIEIGARLRRLKPEIAVAWSADQVDALLQLRERLR